MPGPPVEASEQRAPLVVAMGIRIAPWATVMNQFPRIRNCCICVTKAFRKQEHESTDGSGFDEGTRSRMKKHETWATAWAAGACVLREFGFLIVLCNHGRHRSLSLAYELAAHFGCKLLSIRESNHPGIVKSVKTIMTQLTSRLTWHVNTYGCLSHPVAGILVCICKLDGKDWAQKESFQHRRHSYLNITQGDLLVQLRRTPDPSECWAFGCKVQVDRPGEFGWFPASCTKSLPAKHFRSCYNLFDCLMQFESFDDGLGVPGPPVGVSEKSIPLVVAMGIQVPPWREVMREFPRVCNCCICLTKAFRKQEHESTAGSGFDAGTRYRMKTHETWATAWAAGACVLREFGFLIVLCNHGRHRSLSLAYELANQFRCELFSIRDSDNPRIVKSVEDIMTQLTSRLTWHVNTYGHLGHPVAGILVCICKFDGTDWAQNENSEHCRHRYLNLTEGDLLVQQSRTLDPSECWGFGCKVEATCQGEFGWFPPSHTKSLPPDYFNSCYDLSRRLLNF